MNEQATGAWLLLPALDAAAPQQTYVSNISMVLLVNLLKTKMGDVGVLKLAKTSPPRKHIAMRKMKQTKKKTKTDRGAILKQQ